MELYHPREQGLPQAAVMVMRAILLEHPLRKTVGDWSEADYLRACYHLISNGRAVIRQVPEGFQFVLTEYGKAVLGGATEGEC